MRPLTRPGAGHRARAGLTWESGEQHMVSWTGERQRARGQQTLRPRHMHWRARKTCTAGAARFPANGVASTERDSPLPPSRILRQETRHWQKAGQQRESVGRRAVMTHRQVIAPVSQRK